MDHPKNHSTCLVLDFQGIFTGYAGDVCRLLFVEGQISTPQQVDGFPGRLHFKESWGTSLIVPSYVVVVVMKK